MSNTRTQDSLVEKQPGAVPPLQSFKTAELQESLLHGPMGYMTYYQAADMQQRADTSWKELVRRSTIPFHEMIHKQDQVIAAVNDYTSDLRGLSEAQKAHYALFLLAFGAANGGISEVLNREFFRLTLNYDLACSSDILFSTFIKNPDNCKAPLQFLQVFISYGASTIPKNNRDKSIVFHINKTTGAILPDDIEFKKKLKKWAEKGNDTWPAPDSPEYLFNLFQQHKTSAAVAEAIQDEFEHYYREQTDATTPIYATIAFGYLLQDININDQNQLVAEIYDWDMQIRPVTTADYSLKAQPEPRPQPKPPTQPVLSAAPAAWSITKIFAHLFQSIATSWQKFKNLFTVNKETRPEKDFYSQAGIDTQAISKVFSEKTDKPTKTISTPPLSLATKTKAPASASESEKNLLALWEQASTQQPRCNRKRVTKEPTLTSPRPGITEEDMIIARTFSATRRPSR